MDAAPPPFRFDAALTPQQNIDKYFDHMETEFPEQTKLLKDNIGKMLPLPPEAARTAQRQKFTSELVKSFDTVPKGA